MPDQNRKYLVVLYGDDEDPADFEGFREDAPTPDEAIKKVLADLDPAEKEKLTNARVYELRDYQAAKRRLVA